MATRYRVTIEDFGEDGLRPIVSAQDAELVPALYNALCAFAPPRMDQTVAALITMLDDCDDIGRWSGFPGHQEAVEAMTVAAADIQDGWDRYDKSMDYE